MNLKIIIPIAMSVMGVFASIGTSFAEPEQTSDGKLHADVLASFNYYVPGDSDNFKNGYGGEVQARFWLMEYVGIAVAGGAASWDKKEESILVYNSQAAVAAKASGDITFVPLGGSLLIRPIHIDRVSLTLEGGVRYVFVNSQVDFEAAYADVYGRREYIKEQYDIGNGVVGIISANLEVKIVNPLFVFIGAGYQFDISKGKITLPGAAGSVDNELKAFYGKAGLGLAF
jgi:hypothetical protein